MKLILLALLVGVVAGLAGSLLGVGGGIILVPAFVLGLGLEQKEAVATSLAIIVVTALVGTTNNFLSDLGAEQKLINWKLVGITAAGAAVAAWFGSDLMRTLSNQQLTKAFGVLLVIVGARMLWR